MLAQEKKEDLPNKKSAAIRRCVFFDRDGIVNEPPDPYRYVMRWEDLRIMQGFTESLRTATKHDYHAIIVSNQSAVAKGLVTTECIEDMHRRLKELLARNHHLQLLDIAYCPHDPGECSCRKPQPGLIIKMARKHNINLGLSWMIGDKETDIEAGLRAGCRTILVGSGQKKSQADIKVSSMRKLAATLEGVL